MNENPPLVIDCTSIPLDPKVALSLLADDLIYLDDTGGEGNFPGQPHYHLNPCAEWTLVEVEKLLLAVSA